MDPVGWAIGLGIGALLALLGPLVITVILLWFVDRRTRRYILVLAAALAAIWLTVEITGSSSHDFDGLVIVIGFTMVFGQVALVLSALGVLARFSAWVWKTEAVRKLTGKLTNHARSNN